VAGLSPDDLDPVLPGLRDSQVDLLVEPAGTQDGGVEQVGPVGGADDEDLAGGSRVHLLQQFCDYPVHDLVGVSTVAALGDEGVELVHEDDAGAAGPGPLEHCPHVLLALPHVHVEQFRPLHADEAHPALLGHALPQQRLPRARRTVEEQARARLYPLVEDLRVLDGQQDGLDYFLLGRLQSAHVIPTHLNQVLYLLLLDQLSQLLQDIILGQCFHGVPRGAHKGMEYLPTELIMELVNYLLS
jgi:hypothetical protein